MALAFTGLIPTGAGSDRYRWDCLTFGGQAAAAKVGWLSFAGANRCPKAEPKVPLYTAQRTCSRRSAPRRVQRICCASHGASPCQGCDHRQMRTVVGGQSVLRPGVAESEGWSSPSMAPMPNARPSGAVDHTFRLLGHPLGDAVSRFEPVSVPAIPNQNNLTFGRRTRQPHHNPAYGGSGSGGRDHSCSRRLKPHSRSVHPPGSVRT